MRHMDFTLCIVDLDVWMLPANNSGGYLYYEYALLYTDDDLMISDNV